MSLIVKGSEAFFLCNGFRWPLFFYSHQEFTVLINCFCILNTLLNIYWFVLHFNQVLGAKHFKGWLKSAFFKKMCLKAEKGEKTKIWVKIKQKNMFLNFHSNAGLRVFYFIWCLFIQYWKRIPDRRTGPYLSNNGEQK